MVDTILQDGTKNEKRERLVVDVDKQLASKVRALAENEGESYQTVLRRAIRFYLATQSANGLNAVATAEAA